VWLFFNEGSATLFASLFGVIVNRVCLAFMALPLFSQGLDESFFKGDARKVMAACADRAKAIKSKDSRLLAEYGRAYLMAGQRAKAEEAFTLAKAADAKDAETHRLIAYAWLRSGNRGEALKAIEEMQLLDSKAKNVFTRAAINLSDAGLSKEADALMERAWALDVKDWDNCVAYGRAALRKQRRDVAAKWFARTAQAKPEEERVWNDIALAYADNGAEHR
jgi:Flp pilus assembly protein TadD